MLRVVIAGHVDHGKSTLVGRLLHETGSLPAGRYEAVQDYCRRARKPFEYGFLLDALEEERAQGVTIDTAQVWLRAGDRDVTIFDAPGHREFVKNMVCGAAVADAAFVLVDAREGVREQSRRHGHLLEFLRVDQVAVIVNKMDLCDFDAARFAAIEAEYGAFLGRLGLDPIAFVPASAGSGDNVTKPSEAMPWYDGPTVLDLLGKFNVAPPPVTRPLRFPVQGVYKFDARRILAGRVESGRVRAGDRLRFSPSNKTAVVRSIERWHDQRAGSAAAGESVGLVLEDQVFVERGEVASLQEQPPVVTDRLQARIFWMGKRPLAGGRRYTMKLWTQAVTCEVESFDRILDAATLESLDAAEVPRNEMAEVTLRLRRPIALDADGRFVLVDGFDVCGGGRVGPLDAPPRPTVVSRNITWEEGLVGVAEREARSGHPGAVVWMTGLSGSGKSTLARLLERRLFESGCSTYRLDGDNVRHGLNADLGFSPAERAENIRRVAEVANLFADAGTLVITSFISPYRDDRRRARGIVRAGRFLEVFVDCSLATCEQRDPKGLYRKARAGEIKEFTGISAPYEEPTSAEIHVSTEGATPEEVVEDLVARLREFGLVT